MVTREEIKTLIDQMPEKRLATVRRVLVCLVPELGIPEDLPPDGRKVVALAEAIFDDKKEATCWLVSPVRLLNDACPVDLLSTVDGAMRVEEIRWPPRRSVRAAT